TGSGITNALLNGLNNVYVGAEDQTEAPGMILSVDRVVVKQLGSLIVPTPMFSTPQYGYNTNLVYAGQTVILASAVTDSVTTPTLQWQLENKANPGTFTNLPTANGTNVTIITAGLGDFLPRGVRLVANDGGNSLTSAVVTLTVFPTNYVPKFTWASPVPFGGLNADQILTNLPASNKIAGAMLAQSGGSPITVTPSSGSPIVFVPANATWAGLAGGNGLHTGRWRP